jgi:hypothetical protein
MKDFARALIFVSLTSTFGCMGTTHISSNMLSPNFAGPIDGQWQAATANCLNGTTVQVPSGNLFLIENELGTETTDEPAYATPYAVSNNIECTLTQFVQFTYSDDEVTVTSQSSNYSYDSSFCSQIPVSSRSVTAAYAIVGNTLQLAEPQSYCPASTGNSEVLILKRVSS